jgi:hypothetical protein
MPAVTVFYCFFPPLASTYTFSLSLLLTHALTQSNHHHVVIRHSSLLLLNIFSLFADLISSTLPSEVLAVEAAAAVVVALKTHTHDTVLTHSGVYQMFLIYFRECV